MKVFNRNARAPVRPINMRYISGIAAVLGSTVLVGCGGGGGGGTTAPTAVPATPTPPAAATWATSGSYSPVLKADGSLSATPPSFALSFVHPSNPTVEYVIDAAGQQAVGLGRTLVRGTYNSTTRQVQDLVGVAYVDSPGGANVRTTSLVANGQRPVQAQSPAGALCNDDVVASNFSTPFASQILVATPGADGACGTADDAQTLVSFSASGVPSAAPVTGGRLLGFFASGTTGNPTNWLLASPLGQLALQPIGAGATSILSAAPAGATTSVFRTVINLGDVIAFTQNGALRSVSTTAGPAAVSATLSTLTGPDGWQAAGSDASNAYVYINSSTAASGVGTWRLFSLSRSTQTLTALASGPGSIARASANTQRVFATVLTGSGATGSLLQIAAPSGTQTILVAPAIGTVSGVSAEPSGANLLVTVSTVAGVSSAVSSVVNNAAMTLYSAGNGVAVGGDTPQYDPSSRSFLSTSFIFYSSLGSLFFSGSDIIRFNQASGQTTSLGSIPTGAGLGGVASDPVFAGLPTTFEATGFGGIQIARFSSARVIQTVGNSVYTFNTNVPNSLVRTTQQVR